MRTTKARIARIDHHVTGDRAISGGPIEKVRAASSVARLRKRNVQIVHNEVTDDRPAGATSTARIDIIIFDLLKDRCRRSR